jgi:hypothetical protein
LGKYIKKNKKAKNPKNPKKTTKKTKKNQKKPKKTSGLGLKKNGFFPTLPEDPGTRGPVGGGGRGSS